MTVTVRPFDDMLALPIFRQLDASDQIEADLIRGTSANGISLWADWRGGEPYRLLSFVALSGGTPFAVFSLSHTGQAGIAAGALLARDHRRFRGPLARLGAMIRRRMPAEAAARGIHRVEARCWADHPTAATLLASLGFAHECDMPGFGQTGRVIYRQFAFVPALSACPAPDTPPTANERT